MNLNCIYIRNTEKSCQDACNCEKIEGEHLGERLLKSWNWIGSGVFIIFIAVLFLFYQFDFINEEAILCLALFGIGILVLITGIFKFKWYTPKKDGQIPLLAVGIESRIEALKIEYKELTEAIRHRGSQYLTLESILISGAVVAIAALISTTLESDPSGIKSFIGKGIWATATAMVVIGWVFHLTTSKLDKIYWTRVHDIEKTLGIYGHHETYKGKIENKWWFTLRGGLWHFIYAMLTFLFLLGLSYSYNLIDFPLF
jgi:hypothetical protein